MIHRSIMIFPNFHNLNRIDNIRNRYDPLSDKVRPHITLVFPFKSDLSKEQLSEHIQGKLIGVQPFNLKLKGISGEDGGFLFLNVIEGKDELVDIHNRLYEGILSQYYPKFLSNKSYMPHMTVGRIGSQEELNDVVNQYRTMSDSFEEVVREISVEIIDEDEHSIIEMTIEIAGS